MDQALRDIISHAATRSREGRRELMINDVSRAYFYAPIRRSLFIELPVEDEKTEPGEVGRLNVCLYGARDVAKSWQQTLSAHLLPIGFIRGRGHPAVFHHPQFDIKTLVHGDDYVSSGSTSSLTWLEGELAKQYTIKTQRLADPGTVTQEAKVLNRIVRSWCLTPLQEQRSCMG